MPRKKQPSPPRDEHGSPAFGPGAHPRTAGDFRPSREELLAYIEENPDRSGKRDLARAFSLKGADRVWLKDTLTDLHDEGLVEKDKKRLKRPGTLPHVAVLDIFSRDADGTLTGAAVRARCVRHAGGRRNQDREGRTWSRAWRWRPRARQDLPQRGSFRPGLHRRAS